ncbi:hypothetical protein E4U03_12260 [Rothia nasimurium]|uniref:Uncharacterized protein n=1 Tax=Rothia nasimurium TaxID=85336 RepID=A0A4Y9F028_9MICC|nr:hypothetical protein [Rothia nasimurium]MBF0809370.1 hypothetical protein [Rothia nasimurium]TFU19677.1 hypothetical protein E4U03_12260 [Rothia nasimurium]
MTGPIFTHDVGELLDTDSPTLTPLADTGGAVSELIPAHTRRWVYALYALGSVVLGAIQVGYSAGGFTHPVWLTVATAVWVFLGGSQGLLALLKTPLT